MNWIKLAVMTGLFIVAAVPSAFASMPYKCKVEIRYGAHRADTQQRGESVQAAIIGGLHTSLQRRRGGIGWQIAIDVFRRLYTRGQIRRCLLHRSPYKRQHCAGRRRHRASAASSHIGYTATNTAWRSSEARAIWQQKRGDIARFSTADALVWCLRTAAKTNDNAQGAQNRPHRNAVATAPAHFDASQTSTAFEFALARLVPWHGICGFIGEGSVSSIGYSSLWMKRTPL